jgi:hypothetical protein
LQRDANQERLQRACDLITQVADDLDMQLQQQLRQSIAPTRAGGFLKLGLHVESLNSMAAAIHEIRETRHLELKRRG